MQTSTSFSRAATCGGPGEVMTDCHLKRKFASLTSHFSKFVWRNSTQTWQSSSTNFVLLAGFFVSAVFLVCGGVAGVDVPAHQKMRALKSPHSGLCVPQQSSDPLFLQPGNKLPGSAVVAIGFEGPLSPAAGTLEK